MHHQREVKKKKYKENYTLFYNAHIILQNNFKRINQKVYWLTLRDELYIIKVCTLSNTI